VSFRRFQLVSRLRCFERGERSTHSLVCGRYGSRELIGPLLLRLFDDATKVSFGLLMGKLGILQVGHGCFLFSAMRPASVRRLKLA
jgi:hypothetical protein